MQLNYQLYRSRSIDISKIGSQKGFFYSASLRAREYYTPKINAA